MLVGHLALGLAAKQVVPKISLATLVLATLLADFVAFALMVAGVEGFRVVSPGAKTIVSALAFDIRYSQQPAHRRRPRRAVRGRLLRVAARPSRRIDPLRGRAQPLAAGCHQSSS